MKHILSCIALLPLLGCATITAESEQSILIDTAPQGAVCTITNEETALTSETTPATITVKRSYSPLKVSCEAEGMKGDAILEAGTRGRAYGNILLAGIPALVDASTGKGYEYPESAMIPLSPEGSHTVFKP